MTLERAFWGLPDNCPQVSWDLQQKEASELLSTPCRTFTQTTLVFSTLSWQHRDQIWLRRNGSPRKAEVWVGEC